MSELQKGTAVIPTIDANHAPISRDMSEKLRLLVADLAHLPLRVEMHYNQKAAWENCRVPNTLPGTFAGLPVRMPFDSPIDQIRVMFDSKGRNANGETMGPWIVGQIVNIGLTDYETA